METPDVPDALRTPPGQPWDVGSDPEWFVDPLEDRDGDRLSFALFSGGNDSLASTHYCMTEGKTDAVLHLCTNSGVAENTDYVVDVCREYGWPLLVFPAPMSLVEFGMRYGFPGPSYHNVAYAYFKERQIATLAGYFEGAPDYYTGVRKSESDRRMKTVSGDGLRQAGKQDRWFWLRPINDWSKQDVRVYAQSNGLPRNPVADTIHRSGDCYCGAYAHRDELLIDLRAGGYDAHADWLLEVEEAVQYYRAKVDLFEGENPEKVAPAELYRDRFRPKPMRMPIYRDLYPVDAAWVDERERGSLVNRGRRDERNYWGHGKMASKELSALISENDERQFSLCQFCGTNEINDSI